MYSFSFHKIFNESEVPEIEEQCRGGKIGCVQCKKKLADKMIEYLGPIYERRQDILKKPDMIKEVICMGNKKAKEVSQKTMEEVRRAMKIDFI